MKIYTRADWDFPGFAKDINGNPRIPASVRDSVRTEFFVHYEGGNHTRDTGAVAMRNIDAGHRRNGWSCIGYNFVVMQDGSAWEGRGWPLVGAHCPDHNTTGWGVQVHIGGDQQPTQEALNACRVLYDEACARAGRTLAKRGHRDGYATECPGAILYAWVQAGMPATVAPKEEGDGEMVVYVEPEGQQPGDGVYCVTGDGVYGVTAARWAILRKYAAVKAVTIPRAEYSVLVTQVAKPVSPVIDVAALATALAMHLPTSLDPASVASTVVAELSARLAQ